MVEEIFKLDEFSINTILDRIASEDAVSLGILRDDFRKELVQEARSYSYSEEDEYVGSGDKTVIQQMATFKTLPEDSKFLLLKEAFNKLIKDKLSLISLYPFETEIDFNSHELIKYNKDSIGITPHRDGLKFINLVCIFNISGTAGFFTCDDRQGNNPREFDSSPGNVVIMRAPGFLGSDHRPFHFVTNITEERYVFGLRQKKSQSS